MTDDFFRYGTIGGAYAGIPKEIASLFEGENIQEAIDKPLILTHLNGDEIKWPTALDYISNYIELFRQWAYRRGDGDKTLLQEIDSYIRDLYEWLKQARIAGQFDTIEGRRLQLLKESLTEKLHEYVPERLIDGGQASIDRLFSDIQNSEHINSYPSRPSEKWYNAEIERLCLLSEKIDLLRRLVKKIHPETADKYHYLYYLDQVISEIIGHIGVLERNRDELYASVGKGKIGIEEHFSKLDRDIDTTSRNIKRHYSDLNERLVEFKPLEASEIIKALKLYGNSKDIAVLPPIRQLYNSLRKYEEFHLEDTSKLKNGVVRLGIEISRDSRCYSTELDLLSSDEAVSELENFNLKDNIDNSAIKATKNILIQQEQQEATDRNFVLRALNTLCENQKQGGFKEYLHDLEVQLSTFIVPTYEEFVNSLSIASQELKNFHDEYDFNELHDIEIYGLLFDKDHKFSFSRKLFQIQELLDLITRTTSHAFPSLREELGRLTNNIRRAVFEVASADTNCNNNYYPLNKKGIAWDSMQHFQRLTKEDLRRLLKLSDNRNADDEDGCLTAKKLADLYEKWALIETDMPPDGYNWSTYRRSVIYGDEYQSLYKLLMNQLLHKEKIDQIDQIYKLHGELWNIVINLPKNYKDENDIVLIQNEEMREKAMALVRCLRSMIDSGDVLNNAPRGMKQPKQLIADNSKVKKKGAIPLLDYKSRFKIEESRIFFDDADLDLPTGKVIQVANALIENFDRVVKYKLLDTESSEKEASDNLRAYKSRFNKALKNKNIPCTVKTKRQTGYILTSK